MSKEKLEYNWTQFDDDCITLAKKIRGKFRPATIIALARGGLCLGVKISHKLHQPLMIVSAKTYNENKKSSSTVLLNSSYTLPLKSPVLIVDEIADSGKTLNIIKEHFESLGVDVRTAVILYKKRSIIKPDFYCREVENNTWVNFCWEN